MEAKELMIGDKVMVKVLSQIPDTYVLHTWTANDYSRDFKVMPIPLTPEILEKNGFERGVEIPSNFYRNIDNERLIFSPHSSCYGLVYVHWNESNDADIMHRFEVQQPIMYIHQMQHALRLFGLDELADNFKV